MNSISGGSYFAEGYVPGPNVLNPGGLLQQSYVPQPDGDFNQNALATFANPNSGRINQNALTWSY